MSSANFGMRVPLVGVVRVIWPAFLKLCPNYILEIGEAVHFEFSVLIDAQEYECMHASLPLKGMCLESRDPFKFWEI